MSCKEMLLYQCLPIKLKDKLAVYLPPRLDWVAPLLELIPFPKDKYVYLTAKHMYVTPENRGNRAGWHSDGFMTDDVNYIWADCMPTEFAVQDFDIDEDCVSSLRQFEEQVKPECIVTYPPNTLIKLTPENIHRVSTANESGFRTFVKVSISDHKYNLLGNSRNYLMDYDWEMVPRKETRNHQSSEVE